MQRQSSGFCFTGSGSITSSTTGKCSGKRTARALRAGIGGRFSTTMGVGGFGAASTANSGSRKSSCSCAGSRASLLTPKTRRASASSFCRSSSFSRRLCTNAAWHSLNWRASSCSRNVIGCKIGRAHMPTVQSFPEDFSVFAFVPRTQFGPAQIHPISQHRQRLRRQLQLGRFGRQVLRPRKGSLLQSLAQHPDPRPVPPDDFDPRVPAIAEHKQRAALEVLPQVLGHQGMQPVEPFAHVTGAHAHEHLQAAREAQHGLDSSRTTIAAKAACFSSATSSRTPPGNSNTSKVPLAAAGGDSTTASNSRSRGGRPDRFPPRLWFTQLARVEYFSPVRRANWGSPSPLRTNAVRMSRRCAFDTRSRPFVSAMTGNFGNTAPSATEELSEPFAVIIALRTIIILRI